MGSFTEVNENRLKGGIKNLGACYLFMVVKVNMGPEHVL